MSGYYIYDSKGNPIDYVDTTPVAPVAPIDSGVHTVVVTVSPEPTPVHAPDPLPVVTAEPYITITPQAIPEPVVVSAASYDSKGQPVYSDIPLLSYSVTPAQPLVTQLADAGMGSVQATAVAAAVDYASITQSYSGKGAVDQPAAYVVTIDSSSNQVTQVAPLISDAAPAAAVIQPPPAPIEPLPVSVTAPVDHTLAEVAAMAAPPVAADGLPHYTVIYDSKSGLIVGGSAPPTPVDNSALYGNFDQMVQEIIHPYITPMALVNDQPLYGTRPIDLGTAYDDKGHPVSINAGHVINDQDYQALLGALVSNPDDRAEFNHLRSYITPASYDSKATYVAPAVTPQSITDYANMMKQVVQDPSDFHREIIREIAYQMGRDNNQNFQANADLQNEFHFAAKRIDSAEINAIVSSAWGDGRKDQINDDAFFGLGSTFGEIVAVAAAFTGVGAAIGAEIVGAEAVVSIGTIDISVSSVVGNAIVGTVLNGGDPLAAIEGAVIGSVAAGVGQAAGNAVSGALVDTSLASSASGITKAVTAGVTAGTSAILSGGNIGNALITAETSAAAGGIVSDILPNDTPQNVINGISNAAAQVVLNQVDPSDHSLDPVNLFNGFAPAGTINLGSSSPSPATLFDDNGNLNSGAPQSVVDAFNNLTGSGPNQLGLPPAEAAQIIMNQVSPSTVTAPPAGASASGNTAQQSFRISEITADNQTAAADAAAAADANSAAQLSQFRVFEINAMNTAAVADAAALSGNIVPVASASPADFAAGNVQFALNSDQSASTDNQVAILPANQNQTSLDSSGFLFRPNAESTAVLLALSGQQVLDFANQDGSATADLVTASGVKLSVNLDQIRSGLHSEIVTDAQGQTHTQYSYNSGDRLILELTTDEMSQVLADNSGKFDVHNLPYAVAVGQSSAVVADTHTPASTPGTTSSGASLPQSQPTPIAAAAASSAAASDSSFANIADPSTGTASAQASSAPAPGTSMNDGVNGASVSSPDGSVVMLTPAEAAVLVANLDVDQYNRQRIIDSAGNGSIFDALTSSSGATLDSMGNVGANQDSSASSAAAGSVPTVALIELTAPSFTKPVIGDWQTAYDSMPPAVKAAFPVGSPQYVEFQNKYSQIAADGNASISDFYNAMKTAVADLQKQGYAQNLLANEVVNAIRPIDQDGNAISLQEYRTLTVDSTFNMVSTMLQASNLDQDDLTKTQSRLKSFLQETPNSRINSISDMKTGLEILQDNQIKGQAEYDRLSSLIASGAGSADDVNQLAVLGAQLQVVDHDIKATNALLGYATLLNNALEGVEVKTDAISLVIQTNSQGNVARQSAINSTVQDASVAISQASAAAGTSINAAAQDAINNENNRLEVLRQYYSNLQDASLQAINDQTVAAYAASGGRGAYYQTFTYQVASGNYEGVKTSLENLFSGLNSIADLLNPTRAISGVNDDAYKAIGGAATNLLTMLKAGSSSLIDEARDTLRKAGVENPSNAMMEVFLIGKFTDVATKALSDYGQSLQAIAANQGGDAAVNQALKDTFSAAYALTAEPLIKGIGILMKSPDHTPVELAEAAGDIGVGILGITGAAGILKAGAEVVTAGVAAAAERLPASVIPGALYTDVRSGGVLATDLLPGATRTGTEVVAVAGSDVARAGASIGEIPSVGAVVDVPKLPGVAVTEPVVSGTSGAVDASAAHVAADVPAVHVDVPPTFDAQSFASQADVFRGQYLDEAITPGEFVTKVKQLATDSGVPEAAVQLLSNMNDLKLNTVLANDFGKLATVLSSGDPEIVAYGSNLLKQLDTFAISDTTYLTALQQTDRLSTLTAIQGDVNLLNNGSGGLGLIYSGKLADGTNVILKADRVLSTSLDGERTALEGLAPYGGPASYGTFRIIDPTTGVWREAVAMEKIDGVDLMSALRTLRSGGETPFAITDAHVQAIQKLEAQLAADGKYLSEVNLGDFMLTADPARPIVPLDMYVTDNVGNQIAHAGLSATDGTANRLISDFVAEARDLSKLSTDAAVPHAVTVPPTSVDPVFARATSEIPSIGSVVEVPKLPGAPVIAPAVHGIPGTVDASAAHAVGEIIPTAQIDSSVAAGAGGDVLSGSASVAVNSPNSAILLSDRVASTANPFLNIVSPDTQVQIWQARFVGDAVKAEALTNQVEASLASSRIASIADVGIGSTNAQFVELADGTRAVWKSIETSQAGLAEVAVYEIDRVLGSNMVPVTVAREINGVPGTIQLRVESLDAVVGNSSSGQAIKYVSDPQAYSFLDGLVGNFDRSYENVFSVQGVPVAIDQGAAFSGVREYKQFTDRVDTLVAGNSEVSAFKTFFPPKNVYDNLVNTSESQWREILSPLISEDGIKDFLINREKIIASIENTRLAYGDEVFPDGIYSPLMRDSTVPQRVADSPAAVTSGDSAAPVSSSGVGTSVATEVVNLPGAAVVEPVARGVSGTVDAGIAHAVGEVVPMAPIEASVAVGNSPIGAIPLSEIATVTDSAALVSAAAPVAGEVPAISAGLQAHIDEVYALATMDARDGALFLRDNSRPNSEALRIELSTQPGPLSSQSLDTRIQINPGETIEQWAERVSSNIQNMEVENASYLEKSMTNYQDLLGKFTAYQSDTQALLDARDAANFRAQGLQKVIDDLDFSLKSNSRMALAEKQDLQLALNQAQQDLTEAAAQARLLTDQANPIADQLKSMTQDLVIARVRVESAQQIERQAQADLQTIERFNSLEQAKAQMGMSDNLAMQLASSGQQQYFVKPLDAAGEFSANQYRLAVEFATSSGNYSDAMQVAQKGLEQLKQVPNKTVQDLQVELSMAVVSGETEVARHLAHQVLRGGGGQAAIDQLTQASAAVQAAASQGDLAAQQLMQNINEFKATIRHHRRGA